MRSGCTPKHVDDMAKTFPPTPDNVVDLHREVSIQLLKSSPAFAVRTPRGQKDPGTVNWDPRSATREKSAEVIRVVSSTNDNLGVHLFGRVVDVDIDSDNPILMAALDFFLPPTSHVWGRKSRPRTHRLYELSGVDAVFEPAEFPFLNAIKETPEIAVEVRGGSVTSGKYSLLPGSIHPSGEAYEWQDIAAARSTPTQISLTRLMDAVRSACVVALVAPYWVEGSRNELCKALSGFLFRAVAYSNEIGVGMPFDKDGALRILEAVMYVANDDPSDARMRVKTFEHTWEKGEKNQPIVGATRLAEITNKPDILRLLYVLLAQTPDLLALESIFARYVVLRNTTNVLDLDVGAGGTYVMNKEAFVFTLGGSFITTTAGRIPVSAIFVNSPRRVVVDKIAIDPQKDKVFEDTDGTRTANIWAGWGVPPIKTPVQAKDVEPFLRYLIEVVCRNDKELYDWLLMWIADIFQNPSTKPGTAVVLVGRQGAGKSFLFENVLRPMIGSAHFAKVSTAERLTSKFNAHLGGKVFIQGEEVVNSNRRADAEALKDAITSSKRTVEHKGRDSFEINDCARYGFTSNHVENAVHVGSGDRRFTVISVSDDYSNYDDARNEKTRQQFWRRLFGWAEESPGVPNQANLGALHAYLLTIKVEKEVIRRAHETAAKRLMKLTSSRGMDSWLHSLLEKSNPFEEMHGDDPTAGRSFLCTKKGVFVETRDWPQYVNYGALETAFRQAVAKEHGETRTAQQIAKHFKDNGLVTNTEETKVRVGSKRVRVRPFPTRASIVKFLQERGYFVLETSVEEDAAEEPTAEKF